MWPELLSLLGILATVAGSELTNTYWALPKYRTYDNYSILVNTL